MTALSMNSLAAALSRATGHAVVLLRVGDRGPDWLADAFPSLDEHDLEELEREGHVAIVIPGMLDAQARFNELTRDAQAADGNGAVTVTIAYVGPILGAGTPPVITTSNTIGRPDRTTHLFRGGTLAA